jgi:Lactonase, 7-bladed beta-propeller
MPNAIVGFARDARTGRLRPVDCVADRKFAGCTLVPEIRQIGDIAMSPDGRQVYIGDPRTAAITTLAREPNSGRLSFAGCDARPDGNCTNDTDEGRNATDLSVSPNGDLVARIGPTDPGLTVFRRDQQTGRLTTLPSAAAGTVPWAWESAFSKDGRYLFVSEYNDLHESGEISVLTADGSRRVACYAGRRKQGCKRIRQLRGQPVTIAVSADGKNLYTGGDRIISFSVAPDGHLRPRDCLADEERTGCRKDPIMGAASGIATLPDDSGVLDVIKFGSIVGVLRRARTSGRLQPVSSRHACVYGEKGSFSEIVDPTGKYAGKPPCQRVRGMTYPGTPAISPDGRHAYLPTVQGITVLRLDGR